MTRISLYLTLTRTWVATLGAQRVEFPFLPYETYEEGMLRAQQLLS